jgi:PTS system maltose and glucose-specific IIC component
MRRRNSFFEVLQFPLEVLFFAVILLGIGNLLTSSMFSSFWVIRNPYVLMIAEALMRIGTFLITNFPFLFVIRLVSVKGGGAATNISGLAGYAAFLVMTMFFTKTNLTATAYSSIFGISVASSSVEALSTTTHYPLQTGVIGAIFVSLITVSSYKHSRGRSQYGFFAFIDRDAYCVIRTVFFCCLAGVGTALLWPYLLSGLQQILDFIAADTTNPINLTLYGVLDRFMSVLNLNTLTRQPFWYGADGGTWINNVGGSIAGDVNIWAKQLAAGSLTGMAGRFITPYYVLNLFAVPGMIWAVYSLKTDLIDKRRTRLFFILATVVSLFSGTLLPLELVLFLLCPLLFLMHLVYTGVLFGVFQAMHVYLGFNYSGTSTITAMPGTLMEFLSYLNNPTLRHTLIVVAVVGVVSFFVYFLMTQLYFRHLAVDLFKVGDTDRMVAGTIKAVGGLTNIKMIHSSAAVLTVQVFDPNLMDIQRLKELGASRITDTKAGYAISYGAASTMVRMGMNKSMRDSIRQVRS